MGIDDSDPLDLLDLDRDDPHGLIPIRLRGNFNEKVEIAVQVELSNDDKKLLTRMLQKRGFRPTFLPSVLQITDVYSFEGSIFKGRTGKWAFDPQGTFKRGRKIRRLSEKNEIWQETVKFLRKRMPGIFYFPNFLFDFPRRIYLDTKDEDDAKEAFYRNLLAEILSSVDSGANLEKHISERISSDNPPDTTALNQLLLQLGRRVTDDVFESWNEIFQRRPSTKAVFKANMDSDALRYLELSIEDSDGLYYIDERSLGFRWFFVFSLVTKYKRSSSGNADGIIYLFDEPASNLHASAQSQLLASLEHLSANCTIIYTTHSHHLINPNWLENTYVVKNMGFDFNNTVEFAPNGTDIVIERYRSFANKHPDQTPYFQPILDVLDYKPSSLEMVPEVVLVEGKNDFYTFAYMREVIGINKSSDLRIVPGSGAGSLDGVIRLYLGWAKNFVILLDSDSEGEKQKQRYLSAFGPILKGRLFTLKDLHPELKGKELENGFEENERKAAVMHIYPTESYSKKLFNRAIQECLATKYSLHLSPTTKHRFSEIFSRLSLALENMNSEESSS